jgi:hypothetical protein
MIAIDTKIQSLEDLARRENRFDDLKECVDYESCYDSFWR